MAAIKIANPNLIVVQCLNTSGNYTEKEYPNKTFQMATCRYCNENEPPEKPPSLVHATSSSIQVSNLTQPPASTSCSHSTMKLKDPSDRNYSKKSSISLLSSSLKRKRDNNLAPGSKEICLTAKQAQPNRVIKK